MQKKQFVQFQDTFRLISKLSIFFKVRYLVLQPISFCKKQAYYQENIYKNVQAKVIRDKNTLKAVTLSQKAKTRRAVSFPYFNAGFPNFISQAKVFLSIVYVLKTLLIISFQMNMHSLTLRNQPASLVGPQSVTSGLDPTSNAGVKTIGLASFTIRTSLRAATKSHCKWAPHPHAPTSDQYTL